MRKVEDDAQRDQLVHERAAEPRQPSVLRGPVRERVAAVPGQPGHPHPELPERLRRPELVAELLDALEREHEPDPVAGREPVEVGGRPHLHDPLRVFRNGAVEAGRLAERLAEGPLGLAFELDEDRADLQADAAGLEQRQPGAGERALLAEAELAVGELEQEVEMAVRDHARQSTSARRGVPGDGAEARCR